MAYDLLSEMTDPESPAFVHPTIARYATLREKARDLFEGEERVHAGRTLYLPTLPRERPAYYALRLADSVLTNFFRSIVKSARGMVFSRPPSINPDAGPFWATWYDDVTADGTRGSVFFKATIEEMISQAFCGVLTDYPQVSPGLNLAVERANNVNPYLTMYAAQDCANFEVGMVNGQVQWTFLSLREQQLERAGTYGMKLVTRYRHYHLRRRGDNTRETMVTRQVHTFHPDAKSKEQRWTADKESEIVGTDLIPFVEFSVDPEAGPFAARPPLADVVNLNLAHYRTTSHRRWAITASCFPLPVRKGYKPKATTNPGGGAPEVEAGPTAIIDIPADGDFRWEGPPDTAFTPTEKEILKLEVQISALGYGFQTGETRYLYDETATAKVMNQRGRDATLGDAAKSLEDAMNEVGFHVAKLAKQDAPPLGLFTVSADFQKMSTDPTLLTALSNLEQNDQLSLETLLEWIRTGRMPDDFDVEQEMARIMLAMDEKIAKLPPVNIIQGAPVTDRPLTGAAAATVAAQQEPNDDGEGATP